MTQLKNIPKLTTSSKLPKNVKNFKEKVTS